MYLIEERPGCDFARISPRDLSISSSSREQRGAGGEPADDGRYCRAKLAARIEMRHVRGIAVGVLRPMQRNRRHFVELIATSRHCGSAARSSSFRRIHESFSPRARARARAPLCCLPPPVRSAPLVPPPPLPLRREWPQPRITSQFPEIAQSVRANGRRHRCCWKRRGVRNRGGTGGAATRRGDH